MAIRATAVEELRVCGVDRPARLRVRCAQRVQRARVARVGVAALAEERRFHGQHRPMGRTVGVVTGQAALTHGSVLEENRSALVGVALIAAVIDAVCRDQFRRLSAVRIVTACARHLLFAERMV